MVFAHNGPFDGKNFKGRIAYSADGNFNDEDDWAASAFALAIFAEFGVKDKLVHFDYNCILPKTDKSWEKENEISIQGSIDHFGYSPSLFYDCQGDLDAAVNSIRDAINASSGEDPLYFILAGPMEVPALGIAKSDPEKRKFVYCISHNVWNDGYASRDIVNHNKRDVIPTGITWIQITDQNQFLSTGPYGRPSTSLEWQPWTWLLTANDKNLNFLWDRLVATTRADCSDSGMAYFLMTGDEQPEISKLRKLLAEHEIPKPMNPRQTVRIEAENFFNLAHFEIDYRNDRRVSQRISIISEPVEQSRISTIFNEPYTAPEAIYDVDIRYFDQQEAIIQLQMYINNEPASEPFIIPANNNEWDTFTIEDVKIEDGSMIMLNVRSDEGYQCQFDYIQLNLKNVK
jgi:hypothetical protein